MTSVVNCQKHQEPNKNGDGQKRQQHQLELWLNGRKLIRNKQIRGSGGEEAARWLQGKLTELRI